MACQGSQQSNFHKKRLHTPSVLGPLGGETTTKFLHVGEQRKRQKIGLDRDNPGTGENFKEGAVPFTERSTSQQHDIHAMDHVKQPTSVIFQKYIENGTIQPGTVMPILQSRMSSLPFSVSLSGSAGLSRRVPQSAAKRRSSLYAKECKRVKRDGGQAQIGNHRNVMVQEEAGSTDPPAVSIAVATERPPDITAVKRPAPIVIRGAFCKRRKIPRIT